MEEHPECGLIHSDFDMVYVGSGLRIQNYQKYKKTTPQQVDFLSILNGKSPIRTCTVVARRDLIVEVIASDPVLFTEERFLMGDIPLCAELSRITRYCVY